MRAKDITIGEAYAIDTYLRPDKRYVLAVGNFRVLRPWEQYWICEQAQRDGKPIPEGPIVHDKKARKVAVIAVEKDIPLCRGEVVQLNKIKAPWDDWVAEQAAEMAAQEEAAIEWAGRLRAGARLAERMGLSTIAGELHATATRSIQYNSCCRRVEVFASDLLKDLEVLKEQKP